MPLGVCTGPLRGKPLNSWQEVDFPASRVFAPNLWGYYAVHETDGFLYAFGYNIFGKLGIGVSDLAVQWVSTPTKTNIQNVVKMVGDLEFTVALDSSGRLWGAGHNFYGALGTGTATQREQTFIRLDDPHLYSDVAAGKHRILAIRTDGSLWGWGANGNSQKDVDWTAGLFTDSASGNVFNPTQLGSNGRTPAGAIIWRTNWSQVACTNDSSFALNNAGELYGRGNGNVLCDGSVAFASNDRDFEIRVGKQEGTFSRPTGFFVRDPFIGWERADATYTSITCGTRFALGRSGVQLYGFGGDKNGQFGMGDQQVVTFNVGFTPNIFPVFFNGDVPGGSTITNEPFRADGVTPNVPWVTEYYKNSLTRYRTTTPPNWDTITGGTASFLGQSDWYDKNNLTKASPYAIQITLGPYTATNTLIPTGTIKCSGYTTFFLTGKRLYACGDLSFMTTGRDTQNATEIWMPADVQGSIDEFDVDREDNSGILRVGNKIYLFGRLNWGASLIVGVGKGIRGGQEINKPVKYIVRNTTLGFDPIQPVAP